MGFGKTPKAPDNKAQLQELEAQKKQAEFEKLKIEKQNILTSQEDTDKLLRRKRGQYGIGSLLNTDERGLNG